MVLYFKCEFDYAREEGTQTNRSFARSHLKPKFFVEIMEKKFDLG